MPCTGFKRKFSGRRWWLFWVSKKDSSEGQTCSDRFRPVEWAGKTESLSVEHQVRRSVFHKTIASLELGKVHAIISKLVNSGPLLRMYVTKLPVSQTSFKNHQPNKFSKNNSAKRILNSEPNRVFKFSDKLEVNQFFVGTFTDNPVNSIPARF